MQVLPCGGVGGVVGGGALLGQTGHDAQRHPGALAVQDGLVHGQADGLAQHLHDPAGQVDVVVLQQGVANGDKTGHLVAVQSDLIKSKGQLVDGRAHLGPHGLGHSARDGLAGLAAHVADPHSVQQLAVPVHVLGHQLQEHHGDGQLAAGHGPALALHAAQLGQEGLGVLLGQNGGAALAAQGVKGPLVAGQGPDVDVLHVHVTSHFLPVLGAVLLGLGGAALQLLQLLLHVLDILGQGLLLALVGGPLVLKRFDLGGHSRLLLLVAGLHLVDGGLQCRLPGNKLGVLFLQRGQLRLLGVNGAPEHQCFQHGRSPFSS